MIEARDPLVAAAAWAKAEGLATKPCEVCLRSGRPLGPPDVYVARRIGPGVSDGSTFVVYECTVCGHADTFPVPRHFLLATDVRRDAAEIVGEAATRPSLYYEVDDDDVVTVYVDPADGGDPAGIAYGKATDARMLRVTTALDWLAGGDASR